MIYKNKNFSWRRISQSEMGNSAAAAKTRAGKKLVLSVAEGFLLPTPFLFARPSRIHLKSFQEICSKIVRA